MRTRSTFTKTKLYNCHSSITELNRSPIDLSIKLFGKTLATIKLKLSGFEFQPIYLLINLVPVTGLQNTFKHVCANYQN